jgi:lysyl-tRNA synthetase class 2
LGKTKVGEISIFATNIILLAPCLHDLPKEQYAITDYDVKYRQRYLDMISNQSTRYNLITRSKIIKYLRNYLDNMDFLEVETPILHTNYGGANAKPFITHHNDYKMNMYMRISPELFLKQLIIGGMGKIYEIGKQFRNESIDTCHLPEFESIELYQSPADYTNMMKLCEDFFRAVVYYIHQTYEIKYKGHELDFEKPFRQIDFLEYLSEKTGYNFIGKDLTEQIVKEDLLGLLEKYNVKCPPPLTIPRILDKLCGHFIESECIQPTFIIHHPKIMSPLAKPHRSNPLITERFELFICESEYANAYTELNDPEIQKQAFNKQFEDKNSGDSEAQNPDMDFVTALEYGLPPTGGLGIGIDRLVMLLTGQESIREIVTFPTMK